MVDFSELANPFALAASTLALPFSAVRNATRSAAVASKSARMYNPPAKPPRAFAEDYPHGARADDAGRLTHTIDGDPITARYVVGRRVVGGADETLTPAQFDAVIQSAIGSFPESLPASALPRGTVGVYSVSRGSAGTNRNIGVLKALNPASRDKVVAHEFGHAVEEIAGPIPTKTLSDELSRVYNDLNSRDWRFAKQERTRVPVDPKYRIKPQHFGYRPSDAPREYWAEAIRAYLADPNYLKTVAPNVAEVIRKTTYSSPQLRDILQFNSLVPFGVLGGWAPYNPDEP